MFSAVKFVAAAVIVVLFGGFLLAGVVNGPTDDAPPAVGASPSAEDSPHPTGLPAEVPEGVEIGTLETPFGPARWVHLVGDETSLPPNLGDMLEVGEWSFVTEELADGTVKLWRSPDQVEWTATELDLAAEWVQLSRSSDGAYWLTTHRPSGLWRSADAVSWEPLDVQGLESPGPSDYAWLLEFGEPLTHEEATIVPFEWSADHCAPTRGLLHPDPCFWLTEVEPGTFELFAWLDLGPLPTVRFEDAEGGVRVVDHEDGTELAFVDGIGIEFVERLTSGDGIPPYHGLAILEGDELVPVELPAELHRDEESAFAADGPGFRLYQIVAGRLEVYGSPNGRGWHHAGTIGDEAGEPVEVEEVDAWSTPTTLYTGDGQEWTTTDGLEWVQVPESPPSTDEEGPFTADGPSLLGESGRPDTGEVEIGPDGVLQRIWFQPTDGEPVPVEIADLGFVPDDCGGGEVRDSYTLITSMDEECSGRREMWIISFDDAPA